MKHTYETSPTDNYTYGTASHPETPRPAEGFMVEATSYDDSYQAGLHDNNVNITTYPNGTFSISRGSANVIERDNPATYREPLTYNIGPQVIEGLRAVVAKQQLVTIQTPQQVPLVNHQNWSMAA